MTELTQIGKYQIVSVVGEGAMGTVYRATDSVIGRTVAIKVMNPEIARDKGHRQRFLREAQAAGSLQHPNVVTIYDLGELDGHLFIAMEFLHGADLEKLMSSPEPMKLQAKLDIIVDVLMGLSYAHKNGIVHRDIKPANIRVSEEGKAKIMDFGVAHLASSDMTKTGVAVGTPSYMAPEQITSGKMLPQTDIFAVGAVMYHLLAGTKPFEAPTLQSLFYRIVTEMPTPLSEVRPGLPAALDNIVRKAMAKEVSDRYATALEMANDIISVRAELSGNPYASTASLTGFSKVGALAEEGEKKTLPPITGAGRSWKPIAMGIGAAAVAIIGWALISGDRNADGTIQVSTNSPAVSSSSMVTQPTAPAAAAAERKESPEPVEQKEAVEKKELPEPPEKKEFPKPPATTKKLVIKPAPPPPRQTRPQQQAPVTQRPVVTALAPAPAPAPPPPPPPPPPAPIISVSPPPAAVQVQRPVEPPPAPVRSPREEINSVVAAYARAIESRDIGAVRRAYPGISSDQARGFEQFFRSTRNMNVTFSVVGLDVSGNTAEARLVGSYEYTSSDGREQRQPVSFNATFRRDGSDWTLRSVR